MPILIDGPNLLVTLESGAGSPYDGARSASVQIELYSYWKEWILLGDNAKYPQMFRTIGGDDLGGGLEAGDYYFLQNQHTSSAGSPQQGGWRIKPPEEDIIYTLVGNLFAQDPNLDIFSVTFGNFNTSIRLQTSSLTQTVITDQMNTIEAKIDIVDENVDEIIVTTDDIQETVNDTNMIVGSIDSQVSLLDTKLDIITVDVSNILLVVDEILKYHKNRTLIDETAFTLTVYDDDQITPIRVYDLKDENGISSITSIFERIPALGNPFSNEFSAEFD